MEGQERDRDRGSSADKAFMIGSCSRRDLGLGMLAVLVPAWRACGFLDFLAEDPPQMCNPL